MFSNEKTLIVVYKDEMLMNQLKKMVESNDDLSDGTVVGTKDDSINIVSWTEKVWLGNKKAGNIKDKVLFLDRIKGTDKLIPVLDIQFDQYGVKYGWAGNQAVLYVDTKELDKRERYDEFLQGLSELPIPETIKNANKSQTRQEAQSDSNGKAATAEGVINQEENSQKNPFEKRIDNIGNAIKKVGNDTGVFFETIFRDKEAMKKQMLFYGLFNLYNKGLETFMKM